MITQITIKEMREIMSDNRVKRITGINIDSWSDEDLEKLRTEVYKEVTEEEFKEAIRACFKPEEFREALIKAGSERHAAIKDTKEIFGETNKYTYIAKVLPFKRKD